MENKMLDDPNRKYVPKKEFITYSVSALGQGMIYAIMSSYISDFYLNVLRVTPIFVLLLMFLARIWDAINDPLMGMIMDAHEPKHGKMLTYIIATPIPIALLTLSLFYAPDISMTAKMIYASVTYVLWGMIYTMSVLESPERDDSESLGARQYTVNSENDQRYRLGRTNGHIYDTRLCTSVSYRTLGTCA